MRDNVITLDLVSEVSIGEFATEASTLGLPPGRFPEKLQTTLGNQHEFVLYTVTRFEAVYKQDLGCITLHVFND